MNGAISAALVTLLCVWIPLVFLALGGLAWGAAVFALDTAAVVRVGGVLLVQEGGK